MEGIRRLPLKRRLTGLSIPLGFLQLRCKREHQSLHWFSGKDLIIGFIVEQMKLSFELKYLGFSYVISILVQTYYNNYPNEMLPGLQYNSIMTGMPK